MTKKKLPIWTKILIFALTIILAAMAIFISYVYSDKENIDSDWSDNSIKILFIGNSHVFTYNVPKQFKTLAKMYGIEISYRDISTNGASLSDSKDKAIKEMQDCEFDYVVIQDRIRTQIDAIDTFIADVKFLSDMAKENGAIPVLYNPAWANIKGKPD